MNMEETNRPKIDRDDFIAAMRESVAERGADWTYPLLDPDWTDPKVTISGTSAVGCLYRLSDGTPGCIIGLALSKVAPDYIPEERVSADEVLDGMVDWDVKVAAAVAQGAQDGGETWGNALLTFERWLGGGWPILQPGNKETS